jgi:RNA polymerase sigma-70 factor (ECF subfamily)
MQPPDLEIIASVLRGDTDAFEELVRRYQTRVFATARRYARRQDEVEDIVQDVFLKAFQRLASFRADAPFEHWLMRLTLRTCYDFLRRHQRNRELSLADLSAEETEWLERFAASPQADAHTAAAARQLLERVMDRLPPSARLVLTLLEFEDRSIKEVAALTGWSIPLVKVRAFRARAARRKLLRGITLEKYL